MFTRLRNAYHTLIGNVIDYAASVRQADQRFRALHGLDDGDGFNPLPPVAVVQSPALPPPTAPEVEPVAQTTAPAEAMPTSRPRRSRAA